MTQKGNAGRSVDAPSASAVHAICSSIAACLGRGKSNRCSSEGEEHGRKLRKPLSPPRADTRSRTGLVKLETHLYSHEGG